MAYKNRGFDDGKTFKNRGSGDADESYTNRGKKTETVKQYKNRGVSVTGVTYKNRGSKEPQ